MGVYGQHFHIQILDSESIAHLGQAFVSLNQPAADSIILAFHQLAINIKLLSKFSQANIPAYFVSAITNLLMLSSTISFRPIYLQPLYDIFTVRIP